MKGLVEWYRKQQAINNDQIGIDKFFSGKSPGGPGNQSEIGTTLTPKPKSKPPYSIEFSIMFNTLMTDAIITFLDKSQIRERERVIFVRSNLRKIIIYEHNKARNEVDSIRSRSIGFGLYSETKEEAAANKKLEFWENMGRMLDQDEVKVTESLMNLLNLK